MASKLGSGIAKTIAHLWRGREQKKSCTDWAVSAMYMSPGGTWWILGVIKMAVRYYAIKPECFTTRGFPQLNFSFIFPFEFMAGVAMSCLFLKCVLHGCLNILYTLNFTIKLFVTFQGCQH